MAFVASRTGDFLHVFERGDDTRRPVVLLHGSGGDERDLLAFGRAVGRGSFLVAPRGRVPWENGWILCPRRPDRGFDPDELADAAEALGRFVAAILSRHALALSPVLLGFSNGAVVATEMLCRRPEAYAGAALLRPVPPRPDEDLPPLPDLPVLLLAGADDRRREPTDAEALATQLAAAGARVDLRVLDGDHGFDPTGSDADLTREWIATL